MKKLNNKITKIFLSFFIVFFILNNLLITSKADVASDLDVDINKYTDSDSLLNTSRYTICNYPSLINSDDRGGIVLNDTFKFKNIGIDDYIVEIVPKEYFYSIGNHYYIGQEYGFFIHTEDRKIDYEPEDGIVYNSTVLVFDIITETDIIETKDTLKTTVKLIFQYKYICMKGGAYFSINGVKFDFEVAEPWVIAEPSYMSDLLDESLEYSMCDDYCLKDISFGANLFNEDELNRGAENYNALDDYGMFFTAFDYSYKGFESAPDKEIKAFIDTAYFVYGTLSNSKASDAIGKIIEIKDLTNDYKSLGSDFLTTRGAVNHKDKNITATCEYNNRKTQLENYKDSKDNPYLIKSAAMIVNSLDKKELKFGINDEVKAIFRVNYEKDSNNKINYTRFTNQIVLSVAKSRSGDTVSCFDGIVTKFVGEPNKKELTLDKEKTISILPNGENLFSFIPHFSGDYEINIILPKNFKVYINGEEYNTKSIKKYIRNNEELKIRVCNIDVSQIGKISIKLSNNLDDISIGSNDNFLIELGNINGMKKITTNNKFVLFNNLYYRDEDNSLEKVDIEPDYNLTYPFNEEYVYYVYLMNNSTDIQNINITFDDVLSLKKDENTNIELNKNYTYFKIDNFDGGQYVIAIKTSSSNATKTSLFTSELTEIQKPISYRNGEYILSIDDNKTYYLGFTNKDNCSADIIIKKLNDSYEWEIVDENGFYHNTRETSKELKRGRSYHLAFMINGKKIETQLIDKNDDYKNKYKSDYDFDVDTQVLKISEDAALDASIDIMTALETGYGINIFYITITPLFDNSKSEINVTNGDELELNFSFPNYVKYFEYSLKVGKNVKPEKSPINPYIGDSYVGIIYLSSITPSLGVGDLEITINKLFLVQNRSSIIEYECNISTKVNNLFYSGSGTSNDPFLINNYRHFNNLRYTLNNSFCYKLINDIDCYSKLDFYGKFDFYGTLDGNNHKIIGITVENYNFRVGLFLTNRGKITNLKIEKSYIAVIARNSNETVYAGMFCGQNYGTIENCSYSYDENRFAVNCSSITPSAFVGGIAGWNIGTIRGCSVNISKLDGYGHKGGITGYNYAGGIIENCNVSGKIVNNYVSDEQQTQYSVGGIVGINYGNVIRCTNNSSISFFYNGVLSQSRVLQPRMGLIIGTNYGNYEGCNNTSRLSKEGLQKVTWQEGILWRKKTYEHDQTLYCKEFVGQDNR